tara:strand:+ start:6637 stop:7500 length:864 start_codon:yes stop_codon:yes gene_type:complete
MYLEKIEEFEKEKKNVYMIRKQEESNLITLSKFLFKNININNTYNMKVVKYGDGFKFQFENAYLQFTPKKNEIEKEYVNLKNGYKSEKEIEKKIKRDKYIIELLKLINIDIINKLKEHCDYLSKEKKIIDEKNSKIYSEIQQREYEYIKNLTQKMFSGRNNAKEMLNLIEKNEEDTPFISFELIGNSIYFKVNSFNIVKKGNKKHYIVNEKRGRKSYIEKCLNSQLYYLNKKIENVNEFKKLNFLKNIKIVNTNNKSQSYESDIMSLLKNMKDYIKIIENQEKIEGF